MANFSVIYGFGPFTIAEEYTAHGPAGVFRKRAHPPAHVPGLNLPTAVVDVVQDAKGDYEGLIMCLRVSRRGLCLALGVSVLIQKIEE